MRPITAPEIRAEDITSEEISKKMAATAISRSVTFLQSSP